MVAEAAANCRFKKSETSMLVTVMMKSSNISFQLKIFLLKKTKSGSENQIAPRSIRFKQVRVPVGFVCCAMNMQNSYFKICTYV